MAYAKIRQVIETSRLGGDEPLRTIRQFFDVDGTLLWEDDPGVVPSVRRDPAYTADDARRSIQAAILPLARDDRYDCETDELICQVCGQRRPARPV